MRPGSMGLSTILNFVPPVHWFREYLQKYLEGLSALALQSSSHNSIMRSYEVKRKKRECDNRTYRPSIYRHTKHFMDMLEILYFLAKKMVILPKKDLTSHWSRPLLQWTPSVLLWSRPLLQWTPSVSLASSPPTMDSIRPSLISSSIIFYCIN